MVFVAATFKVAAVVNARQEAASHPAVGRMICGPYKDSAGKNRFLW